MPGHPTVNRLAPVIFRLFKTLWENLEEDDKSIKDGA